MIQINTEEIKSLNITGEKWCEWNLWTRREKQKSLLPKRTVLRFESERNFSVMPSVIPNANVMGAKLGTRYPEREPSCKSDILLYDYEKGDLIALLEADYITTMRSAAAAINSIEEFAISDFKVISIMGLGKVGNAIIDMLLERYKEQKLVIKLLQYKDQAEKVASRLLVDSNWKVMICKTAEDLIKDSDVIISAVTFATGSLADPAWFKEGCLLVPVHLRGFQECDLCFDKIYADDTAQVSVFKYFDQFKYYAEYTDVDSGEKRGRESDKERIICYNTGLGINDVYAALKIYQEICQ